MIQFPKVISLEEAAARIPDDVTVATAGFVGVGFPEALASAIEARFLESRAPRNLTLVYAAGQGDGQSRGLNHFGHKGMVRRRASSLTFSAILRPASRV